MVSERDTILVGACNQIVSYLQKAYKGWEGAKQFTGTPDRLVRMYQDLCWTPEKIEREVNRQFQVFDNKYNVMLVTGPINVWTLCPHHLLPCQFLVTIGYIPSIGKVLGLSKFARVAEILGKRPIMQEEYSMELADAIEEKLQPKGVAIHVVGRHGCMLSRGVKQNSPVVTSIVRGAFESEQETRAEFFAVVGRQGKVVGLW